MIIHQGHNSLGNHNYNAFFYENCEWFYHFHKNYELVCAVSGEVILTLNGTDFTMTEGDWALVFPNEFHAYRTPVSSYVWIGVFSADFVGEFDTAVRSKRTKDPVFRCDDEILAYLSDVLIIEDQPDLYTLKSALYAACGQFMKKVSLYDAHKETSFIHEIISYMEENYQSEITLRDIAKLYGYEYHYLSRQFHRFFNMNFRSLLNIYRADCARDRLIHTGDEITDIAHSSGFASLRTFNRVFLAQTGMTPSEFRNRL